MDTEHFFPVLGEIAEDQASWLTPINACFTVLDALPIDGAYGTGYAVINAAREAAALTCVQRLIGMVCLPADDWAHDDELDRAATAAQWTGATALNIMSKIRSHRARWENDHTGAFIAAALTARPVWAANA